MKTFITRAYGATKLLAKANAPTIMVSAGIAAMGAAVIVASKQTLKLEEVLEPHVESLDEIEHLKEVGEKHGYNPDVSKAAVNKVYSKVAFSTVKLYAVPTVLFLGGAGLVFGGHRIMLKRNATLAIALSTVSKAYETYRARAREAMGPEFDQAMLRGYTVHEERDPETGEIVKTHRTLDMDNIDPYNRVFDEVSSKQWDRDLGLNKMFIAQQQRFANQRLNSQGYLYLSDVYEALGFEETPLSRVVGWKVRYLPDGSRDIPHVDFGLSNLSEAHMQNSTGSAIYLDFNCHGYIVGGSVQKALENA